MRAPYGFEKRDVYTTRRNDECSRLIHRPAWLDDPVPSVTLKPGYKSSAATNTTAGTIERTK